MVVISAMLRGELVSINAWAFLLVFPAILITVYGFMLYCPALANALGGLSNAVTFATALFTYVYVALTGLMVRQMMKSQEEQLRPYVTADLDYSSGRLNLIVQNIGQRAAQNVSFAFDPDLIGAGDRNYSKSHFKEPLAFIPPGKTIKYFIAWGNELTAGKCSQKYEVVITYSYLKNQKAEERYKLDISPFMGMLYQKTDNLNDVVKALGEISRSLNEILRQGIYTKTTVDLEREREAREKRWQEAE